MMNVIGYWNVKGASGKRRLPPCMLFPLPARLNFMPPTVALPDLNHFATRS